MSSVVTPDNERWAVFEDEVLAQGFTQIPNAIIRNPRLSMPAKYLYGLLLSYAWEDPFSFPGQKRLCELCNVKKADTLREYLYELHNAGIITVVRRGQGKTNLYRFHTLVAKDSTKGADTRSTGFQDTRSAGLLETRSTGRNEYSGDEDPPTNNKRREKGRKVKAADLDDVADKWDHLVEKEPFGSRLASMAEILAEANTTGVVAVTRCWRELAEPFIKYYKQEDLSEDAWIYGFDTAIQNHVGNIRYARNTARNYKPGRRANNTNGSHQQHSRSREAEFRAFIQS